MDYRHHLLSAVATSLVSFLLSLPAQAQQLPRYSNTGSVLIVDVRVIDGLGNEPVEGRDILVVDGMIAAIGESGSLEAPDDVRAIDGTGMTAMPGLMDLHIHTQGGWANGLIPGDAYKVTKDDASVQQRLAGYLYAGVTTVLDVGTDHDYVIAKREQINSGGLLGPRFFTTGVPWSQSPSGWDSGNTGSDAFGVSTKVSSFEDLPAQMERYANDGIEIIKLYAGISAMAMQEVIKEAHKREIVVVADLWGLNMNRMIMQITGLDGWAHTGAFVEVSREDLQWMADNGRFVISTITVGEKLAGARVKDEDGRQLMLQEPLIVDIWGTDVVEEFYRVYPQIRESYYEGPESFYQQNNFGDLSRFRDTAMHNIKLAYDVGVQIACGTDDIYASLWPGEAIHREMQLLVMAGVTPLDAIKMCTSNAAAILRRDHEFGSLQTGLVADIILVEGNPAASIDNTRNVRHVFSQGRQVDLESLTFSQ
jgi:imidazolonepropionase-like amidohydrolase